MKSYDVWDTLIGRWYYDPLTIFDEMGEMYPFESFTHHRKRAEEMSQLKELDDIYRILQVQTGIDDRVRRQLLEMELDMERQRTFRIEPICSGFTFDSIAVSDFYFSRKDLENLLHYHNLYPANVYVSYNGKLTGKIWPTIKEKIDLHIGDSYEADVRIPRMLGINTEHVMVSRFSQLESWLYGRPQTQYIACLARAIRLANINPEYQSIWYDASDLNLPILIMFSQYLRGFCQEHGFNKILFTERDCNYLSRIFAALYPKFDSSLFYTSRDAYNRASLSFANYVKQVYTPTTLIVDMQGTGDSCFNFFAKSIGIPPNYFTLVDSDLDRKPRPTKYSLVFRGDGFTDRIERLNYVNIGKVLDVQSNGTPRGIYIIRETKKPMMEVMIQESVIDHAIRYLANGFRLNLPATPRSDELIIFLKHIEQVPLEIMKHVNHEVF